MSSVAARINPGPGLTQVVAHLRDVRTSALTDIRDTDARHLMVTAIDQWIDQAETDRATIEAAHRAGLDVLKVFRGRLPTPTAVGLNPTRHRQLEHQLRRHNWLSAPTGTPAMYRAQRGDVLMTQPKAQR